jgi:hypothetical protein
VVEPGELIGGDSGARPSSQIIEQRPLEYGQEFRGGIRVAAPQAQNQ